MGHWDKRRLASRSVRAAVLVAAFAAVFVFSQVGAAFNPEPPPIVELGAADNFVVLAGAGITNTGQTKIIGAGFGTYPTRRESGIRSMTGGRDHAGDSLTRHAKTDLATAYNTALGLGPASPITGDLGGQTISPGVYASASPITLSGKVILDAHGDPNASFVFRTSSTLTTAPASRVILSNKAQSGNVFWQVGSSVTLGAGSNFSGTILARDTITAGTGAIVHGGILTSSGAVTLHRNTIYGASRHVGGFLPPPSTLAVLLKTHKVFSRPSKKSRSLGRLQARRPLTNERTVLPCFNCTLGTRVPWLHVGLPGRPNGHTGWIRGEATKSRETPWTLVVQTSSRPSVTVYHEGDGIAVFKAIVGKPSTPTPLGTFFVEETVRLRPTDVGAPFALALSARSKVHQRWKGVPGQIALHGLNNIGGTLGTAVSDGSVRLADGAMRWLVRRIGPGVPVTITR